jgi:class 3 adenylate cyclase
VRAALAIQRALAEQNRKNEGSGKRVLAARIALDSGPVVVDAAGEVFGDVPNIAARAQALAEPGSVAVTARVHRQIARLFGPRSTAAMNSARSIGSFGRAAAEASPANVI